MAALNSNFDSLMKKLNPTLAEESDASSRYNRAKKAVENNPDLKKSLDVFFKQQGSYDHETATRGINDIDIVAVCNRLATGGGGKSWSRDDMFSAIAAPLINEFGADNVKYNKNSMCIKVLGTPKIEILPVAKMSHKNTWQHEPFRLYRPENARWEEGFATKHREKMSDKNRNNGNYIPMVKILKHLRDHHGIDQKDAVSFHLECLLYDISTRLFTGSLASCVADVLSQIGSKTSDIWYTDKLYTPCKDRNIFTDSEWSKHAWTTFHKNCKEWGYLATDAYEEEDAEKSLEKWRELFGYENF